MKVSIDTRSLQPGDIFIPIKGPNFDGHNFIRDALEKGASRILDVDIADFARQHRIKANIPVIGITGSSGKTSTKDLLYSVLSTKFRVIKTIENQNNELGVPLTLLAIDDTTDLAIVEMGMRGRGEIQHLASIALPSHAIITSIGHTHLESLGSRKNIARAKAEIFQTFSKSPQDKQAFIPANLACRKTILNQAQKNRFYVHEVPVQALTETNLSLVTEIARHFGLSPFEITQGVANYQPSANRQEIVNTRGYCLINDSYNANPESMVFALNLLGRYPGRKIAILGDMLELGEKSEYFHKSLAKAIEQAEVNKLFTFGQLAQNIQPKLETSHFTDKGQLIDAITQHLKKGDTLLFKASRGMKLEEVFLATKNFIEKQKR